MRFEQCHVKSRIVLSEPEVDLHTFLIHLESKHNLRRNVIFWHYQMSRMNVLNFLALFVLLIYIYVAYRHSSNKDLSVNNIISKTLSTEITDRKLYNANTTKIVVNNHGSRNINPDFVWKKYGREKLDWALILNAWLCVRRNNPNETKLMVYSGNQLSVTKVCTNLKNSSKIKIFIFYFW